MDDETPEQEAERLAQEALEAELLLLSAAEDILFATQLNNIQLELAAHESAYAAFFVERALLWCQFMSNDSLCATQEIVAKQSAAIEQQNLIDEAEARVGRLFFPQ